MSANLLVSVERAEGEDQGSTQPMILTRVSRGITSTAMIAIGETVGFGPLLCKIVDIVHHHAPPQTSLAPNSVMYGSFNRAVSDDEIEILRHHGFKDFES